MRWYCRTEQLIVPFIQSDSWDSKHAFYYNKSDIYLKCPHDCLLSSFWLMELKDLVSVGKDLGGFAKIQSW